MNRLLALALAAGLLLAPAALAQNKPASQPPRPAPTRPSAAKPAEKPKEIVPAKPEPLSKEMEDATKAGPNHRPLEWFEGEWNAIVATPGRDKPDTGTMTCKVVFGDRFLSMEFDGRSRGRFFRGSGMWGYNNLEKRYEATWADSESTAILFMAGKASADGKVFTFAGESNDPVTGRRIITKAVITITGRETWKEEFFAVNGGTESKTMEIVYTRSKNEKTDKPADKPAEKPTDKSK
jgi:hypothetical protein